MSKKLERPTDSLISAVERAAKIRDEAAKLEAEQADREERQQQLRDQVDAIARTQEAKNIEIVAAGSSRDQLLQHYRAMRENVPSLPVAEPYRTPRQQAELEAEQAAGRAAVAKAEAEQALHRERWQREEAAEKAKLGTMEPVYRENIVQEKAFPAFRNR